MVSFTITEATKDNGPLTKQIALVDGKPRSNGARCKMARGLVRRLRFSRMSDLARHYGGLGQNQALCFGVLRDDIPDGAVVRSKRSPEATSAGVYTRTRNCID
jgi:hypothetical protein